MELAGNCWTEIGASGDRSCERLAGVVHCRNCPDYSAAGRKLFERPMTETLLREAAESLAAPKATASEAALSLVVFRIQREWFALRALALERISEVQPVHSVPFRSGGALRGLTNVGGELVLCVSLGGILGLSAGEDPASPGVTKPRLCVIQEGRRRYAFVVDEVLGVRRVQPASMRPVPATVSKSPSALTASCLDVDGRTAGLIDHARLFELIERSLSW